MSLSHSSIKLYEQCPAKYKFIRIMHLKEPSGDAAERGKQIHAELEQSLIGLTLLSPELTYWHDYIETLKSKKVQPELELGIKRDWSPCSFSDPDAWLRGIIDIFTIDGTTAYNADWKTGKERYYEEQLKLYAALVFAAYPAVETVNLDIIYVDLKKTQSYDAITRKEFPSLKLWIDNRIYRIEKDTIFAPRPEYGCKWCHFRKDNGGPCKW
jgi:CRISPR/Cas system-associated exonuclease Cas4 (RecB family)